MQEMKSQWFLEEESWKTLNLYRKRKTAEYLFYIVVDERSLCVLCCSYGFGCFSWIYFQISSLFIFIISLLFLWTLLLLNDFLGNMYFVDHFSANLKSPVQIEILTPLNSPILFYLTIRQYIMFICKNFKWSSRQADLSPQVHH